MKSLKTIACLALALCMMFAFAACGPQASSQPAENDSEKPVLTMATNAAFPPYEYTEGNKIVGIDAEIAALIADKLGMTLQIEDMEFESIIPAVQSGKVDMGMAGLTVNPEREKAVGFTTSYATGKQVIIVVEGSDIASADDLEGKTIGVQLSTTGDIYITMDLVDTNKAKIERYNKGADAVQALVQGKIDAVVIDNEPAKVFVEQNKGLKILETEYITEEYAICVSKDNEALLNNIDTALNDLIDAGEVQKVIDKYIKAE